MPFIFTAYLSITLSNVSIIGIVIFLLAGMAGCKKN